MTIYAKLHEWEGDYPGKSVQVYCPGCECMHSFTIEAPVGPTGKQLNNGITWEWDGNLERPTFSPSLLCFNTVHVCRDEHTYTLCEDTDFESCGHRSHGYAWRLSDGTVRTFKFWEKKPDDAEQFAFGDVSPHPLENSHGNCHSFLRNGRWEFLSDSAHHLAGQTVDLPPHPYVNDEEEE